MRHSSVNGLETVFPGERAMKKRMTKKRRIHTDRAADRRGDHRHHRRHRGAWAAPGAYVGERGIGHRVAPRDQQRPVNLRRKLREWFLRAHVGEPRDLAGGRHGWLHRHRFGPGSVDQEQLHHRVDGRRGGSWRPGVVQRACGWYGGFDLLRWRRAVGGRRRAELRDEPGWGPSTSSAAPPCR